MMFPKDTLVHGGLSTSFTSFDSLLSDLAGRRHTGFVEVLHTGYTGLLFLSEGEVVNAWVEQEDGRGTGKVAARSVAERAGEKNGIINVYASTPDMVLLLHRLTDSRPLFRDLTSAFTSLDRLVAKLRGDGLTGYIEVEVGTGDRGYIYLAGGEPVETVYAAEGRTLTGHPAMDGIMRDVATSDGTFSVYVEGGRDPAAEPSAPLQMTVAAVSSAPSAAEGRRDEVLAFWADVLGNVEETVDALAKPGRFLLAFKEVLVSRAITYPFLDPFAAEFEYSAGKITFEAPLPEEFSKALGDCLSDAISKLAFQLKRTDLEGRVRARLAHVGARHAAVVDRFRLFDELQEFVA
ncbi:MAG: hypothetical protein ACRDHF_03320 [Tepidiformaceae bacterium]